MAVNTVARPRLLAARADDEFQPLDHPYFQKRRVTDGEERYSGLFSPERNWFLREHRLFGVSPKLIGG